MKWETMLTDLPVCSLSLHSDRKASWSCQKPNRHCMQSEIQSLEEDASAFWLNKCSFQIEEYDRRMQFSCFAGVQLYQQRRSLQTFVKQLLLSYEVGPVDTFYLLKKRSLPLNCVFCVSPCLHEVIHLQIRAVDFHRSCQDGNPVSRGSPVNFSK